MLSGTTVTKGQTISKANYSLLNSPKKRTKCIQDKKTNNANNFIRVPEQPKKKCTGFTYCGAKFLTVYQMTSET